MTLDLISIGLGLIDKIIPDPQAKQAAQLELLKLQQSGDLAQLNADTQLAQGQDDINKVEASSSNAFVSGWRPAVGWVCALGLLYALLIQPLCTGFLGNVLHTNFPTINTETLMTLLLGMLGLGGMRTMEKIKGVVK